MKKAVISSFIVAFCLLIIPLPVIKRNKTANYNPSDTEYGESYISASAPLLTDETVFRIKTGNGIENIPAGEYIAGVVAAEMPASYGTEALKAQCVAAYSFALYRKNARQSEEYDLTDSYKTDQSYLSPAALKERWGTAYEENAAKIKEAVAAVAGEYLSFEDKPALALYHSLSPGVTNACRDVFGGDMPYLISVSSDADKLSPDYKSVFSLSAGELIEKLAPVNAAPEGENLFSEPILTESGYVKSIKYGQTQVSGSRVAELLGLPSGNFTAEYQGGAYTFTCFGRGHGVGMSQYGAGRLAEGGSTYTEILNYYYPGTKIVK